MLKYPIMIEVGSNTSPNLLNQQQVTAIRDNFNLLVLSSDDVAGGNAGYAQVLRASATGALAASITDSFSGGEASLILVEAMQESAARHPYPSQDESNEDWDWGILSRELHAVWNIIRRARADHPKASLPTNLINVASLRAEALGESEIAFDLSGIESVYENLTTEDVQYDMNSLSAPETERQELTLSQMCDELPRLLQEYVALTAQILAQSPNASDKIKIQIYGKTFEQLYLALATNQFHTRDGIDAAKALQDKLRFEKQSFDPATLREDLDSKRYLTEVGRKAAMARHDRLYLDGCSGTLSTILTALRSDRFYTQEGIAEARRYVGIE